MFAQPRSVEPKNIIGLFLSLNYSLFKFRIIKTYLLSKLLPLVFTIRIVLILLLIFTLNKKTRFVYSTIICLIVFSNGIVSTLWRFLEYPWEKLDYSLVEYSDGIVVLSGGGKFTSRKYQNN